MSHLLLHVLRQLLGGERAAERVTQVVRRHVAEAGFARDAGECTADVARFERRAGTRGKEPAAERLPAFQRRTLEAREVCGKDVREARREIDEARSVLRSAERARALIERLPDVDLPRSEPDVVRFERETFAQPQASAVIREEERIPDRRTAARGVEQPSPFILVKHALLHRRLAFLLRRL